MNYWKEEREGTWHDVPDWNVHCAFSIRRIIARKGFEGVMKKYMIAAHERSELKCTLVAGRGWMWKVCEIIRVKEQRLQSPYGFH